MRTMCTVAAAALLLAACSPDDAPTPSPGPETSAAAPSQAPTSSPSGTTSELPGFGEGPIPSERPERTTTIGGKLEVTVGEAVQQFEDVTCVDGGGLRVTATADGLTSVQFSTDDGGRIVTASVSLPDQVTGVVGDFVGSASFEGDAGTFSVRGSMATAADGDTELVPFSLTGSCAG